MHRIIRRAIIALIFAIIITLGVFSFAELADILSPFVYIETPIALYFIYGALLVPCIYFCIKPIMNYYEIKNAIKLTSIFNYKIVINGYKVDKDEFDPNGISFWEYRVLWIDDINFIVYLALYY